MRNLLTILNLSMLVLLAGTPEGDYRWWLVLVGAVTAALLWRLAERERKAERQVAGDVAIDQLIETVEAVRQARSPSRDPHQ